MPWNAEPLARSLLDVPKLRVSLGRIVSKMFGSLMVLPGHSFLRPQQKYPVPVPVLALHLADSPTTQSRRLQSRRRRANDLTGDGVSGATEEQE